MRINRSASAAIRLYRDLGPAARFAQINHVFDLPGVVIYHPDAVANFPGTELDEFIFGIGTAGPYSDNDDNIPVSDTCPVEVIDEQGQCFVVSLPGAGDIAHHDGDPLSRFDPFTE